MQINWVKLLPTTVAKTRPKFKVGDRVIEQGRVLTVREVEFYAETWFYHFEGLYGYKVNERFLAIIQEPVTETKMENIVKSFNLKDWFLLYSGLMVSEFECPYCNKYNGDSFLFDFEPDREEYIGECEKCHRKIKILIPKEANNRIYNKIQEHRHDIEKKAEVRSRKYKYEIWVEKPDWEGHKYGLDASKQYGNSYGSTGEYKTKEELIAHIKNMISDWENYDSIAGRMGDKVTSKNTYFESFTDEITLAEILSDPELIKEQTKRAVKTMNWVKLLNL